MGNKHSNQKAKTSCLVCSIVMDELLLTLAPSLPPLQPHFPHLSFNPLPNALR